MAVSVLTSIIERILKMLIDIILPNELLEEDKIDPRWESSPFKHLKKMGAKQKGKRFESIIRHLLDADSRRTTDSDMYVKGINRGDHEIKGSTVTKGSADKFSFLQIRPLQSYDYLTLACFFFDGRIVTYTIPKKDVITLIKNGTFKKQHEGKRGEGATYCYNGKVDIFSPYLFKEFRVTND